jgi:17beta-estradiol 17-dehydrogenase / very-long-chain 3-oxoacyl-CoA reductase
VNNVGVAKGGEGLFHTTPINDVVNMLNVNIFPQTFLSYFFIPKMKERSKRSLIINLASTGALAPVPGLSVYAATKAYNNYLSKTLSIENSSLDIFALRPGYTSTPMIKNKELDGSTITSDELAECTMKHVTCWRHGEVHWKHRMTGWMFENIPECCLMRIMHKGAKDLL